MVQKIRFFEQDPLAATYPRPRLPVLPVLSTRSFHETTEAEFPSRFFGADCVALRTGRAAIAQALRLAGVGPGHEVLIPGYHCGSMVEPALWARADIAFFDIHPDLTLDYGDLERKLSARTRVIIAPHYFGFPQALDPLLVMRERHGFLVIEDCSHALFGSSAGHVLGSRGDFAITSTSKWFAAIEGGALCCNDSPRLSERLPSLSRSARYEVRAALATLTEATDYGRLPLLKPFVGLANGRGPSSITGLLC